MFALIQALCGVCIDILVGLKPMDRKWLASKEREDWGNIH